MLTNISSSLNTILAVLVAYIIIVCTVRPLQNLIIYLINDKSVKDEGKLWPNLFLHGNILELIAISVMFFSNFKLPFFHWDKKSKDIDTAPFISGFPKWIFNNQELISYLVMFFVVDRFFHLLPYWFSSDVIKSLRPMFIVMIRILYILILFDLAMSLSLFILRKFFPNYSNNFIVRFLAIFICVNIIHKLITIFIVNGLMKV